MFGTYDERKMSVSAKIARRLAAPALVSATMIAALTVTAAPAQATTPTYYEIVGVASQKCLDVRREDGGGNGARVQAWQCFGTANQRWTMQPAGTTSTGVIYYQLISQAPGHLCMEVAGSSPSNGAQIDQAGCSQDPNQFWRWGAGRPGRNSISLVSMNSGKCLDVNGTGNGAKVEQLSCNGTNDQIFTTS